MSLQTICDVCGDVIDDVIGLRRIVIDGDDYCEDCAQPKLLERRLRSINSILCSKCAANEDDRCRLRVCRFCDREIPECAFVDRIEGRRCPICAHKLDLELLGTTCGNGCQLCALERT